MLDLKTIREQPDRVRDGLRRRHAPDLLEALDRLLELDREWRETAARRDVSRSDKNRVSKEIGRLKREKKDAESIIVQMQQLSDTVKSLDEQARQLRAEIDDILYSLPNVPHVTTPDGADASENVIVREWGATPEFAFEGKPHWDLGEALGILDLERASKMSGSGFSLFKGRGSKLQRSLIQFMLDTHTTEHGYTEIWPPVLVNRAAMTGTGQLPKFEEEAYRLARQGIDTDDSEGLNGPHMNDLFLIPTAEVPVTNMHSGEILDLDELPIKYASYTPCFRREAGAAGRDTRGILRIHQFDKVELVKFTTPESSYDEHESLLEDAERILKALEVPYRVTLMCAGDLDFKGAKQYDLEIWAAGQHAWLEVSSVSNFEDFQARRMGIRYRPEPRAKPEYVHTLNGSGVALPRLVISLLENNQQADGSVRIPKALQPYCGFDVLT